MMINLIEAKAAKPCDSQAAWVKRRRMEVKQLASTATVQPHVPPSDLPDDAETAIQSMGKIAACQ